MNSLAAAPNKTTFVVDSILETIDKNHLAPGDRLQTVRAIATQFQVSTSVVQAALRRLEERGVIERRDRYATVRDPRRPVAAERPIAQQPIVGVCLPRADHLTLAVHPALTQLLLAREWRPQLIDTTFVHPTLQYVGEDPRVVMDRLDPRHFRSVIVSGNDYWRTEILKGRERLRAVYLFFQDFPGPSPRRAVWLNMEEATYQATRHLIRLGRRPMLLNVKAQEGAMNEESRMRHHTTQRNAGYERALRDAGMATHSYILHRDNLDSREAIPEEQLRRRLTSSRRTDAIVCDSDHSAIQVFWIALQLGMKIPDDLALVGAFDTPWCMECPVPLTSIGFDYEDAARQAVELLAEDGPEQGVRFMAPRLVVRGSCGGVASPQPRRVERRPVPVEGAGG